MCKRCWMTTSSRPRPGIMRWHSSRDGPNISATLRAWKGRPRISLCEAHREGGQGAVCSARPLDGCDFNLRALFLKGKDQKEGQLSSFAQEALTFSTFLFPFLFVFFFSLLSLSHPQDWEAKLLYIQATPKTACYTFYPWSRCAYAGLAGAMAHGAEDLGPHEPACLRTSNLRDFRNASFAKHLL